jgi:hypothetical protein
MPNPIIRARNTVVRHKTKIVFAAGVLTGAGATLYFGSKHPAHIIAPISSDDLRHLADNVESSLHYVEPATRRTITLFNDATISQ